MIPDIRQLDRGSLRIEVSTSLVFLTSPVRSASDSAYSTLLSQSLIDHGTFRLDGYGILHEPTVRQERNRHDLMRDFREEVPGYLNNRLIADALADLPLQSGEARICENLRTCYEKLVSLGVIDPEELKLLDAWIEDLAQISKSTRQRNSQA